MLFHGVTRRPIVQHPADLILAHRLRRVTPGQGADRVVVPADRRVQEREMRRVDAALGRLRPIALLQLLGDEAVRRRHQRELHIGQRGRLVGRPEKGPHVVAPFPRRIRRDLHPLAQILVAGRIARHGWDLQAVAIHVEFPAVIGAANTAVFVAAKEQVRAAMRAARFHQPDAVLAVAERDQVLAEQPDAHRRAVGDRHLPRDQRRDPEPAEQRSHWRARTGAGQRLVLVPGQHGDSSPRPVQRPNHILPGG